MKENHLAIIFQINIFQNKVNNKGINDRSEYNIISHRNTERTTSWEYAAMVYHNPRSRARKFNLNKVKISIRDFYNLSRNFPKNKTRSTKWKLFSYSGHAHILPNTKASESNYYYPNVIVHNILN